MIPKIVIRSDLFDGGANHNRANELLQKHYESSPTALKPMTMTDAERALDLECRALVGEMVKNVPTGKLVI